MADHDDEGMALQSVSDPVEDGDPAPPAIVPENGGDPSGRPRPKRLVPVIVAVAAVVVVVAGLVGWHVVESRRHDSALDSCNRAVKALRGKTGSARMAGYREAAGVNAGQVKDAGTVLAMARSVKNAEGLKQPAIRCKASMSTGDLDALAGQARKLDGRFAAVDRAARGVVASRDAKVLEDARTALDGKKGEAAKLLADSDGKVADKATRDGLQQAIDQAGQVKSDKAKAYQDAANALQAAIDQVNASVQAKSQADQQAAEQAAQAQAAQQQAQQQAQRTAPSYGSGRSGYTPAYRPSANSGGGGGGSAPAPVPAAPQGGNSSGGFDWNQWMQNHKPIGNHGCNPDGSCGIG
ncbi:MULTISPECIES: hypothetical protein [Bifidobacterium]|uniref:hypothetical protein n=1 Tax=Bifidobacterium TaxID=1678 RepID=UPI0018DD6226|nr:MULTISPECIES: hypothetical protein [Bifidobacterium]MBH9981078.1 hypothetical protein [Bifidobacterium asteroides]MBI0100344.1 hypothetical protein [Bifidobacterium sp. W8114]